MQSCALISRSGPELLRWTNRTDYYGLLTSGFLVSIILKRLWTYVLRILYLIFANRGVVGARTKGQPIEQNQNAQALDCWAEKHWVTNTHHLEIIFPNQRSHILDCASQLAPLR